MIFKKSRYKLAGRINDKALDARTETMCKFYEWLYEKVI